MTNSDIVLERRMIDRKRKCLVEKLALDQKSLNDELELLQTNCPHHRLNEFFDANGYNKVCSYCGRLLYYTRGTLPHD